MVGINSNLFQFIVIDSDIGLGFPFCYEHSISFQQPQQTNILFKIEIQKLKKRKKPRTKRGGKFKNMEVILTNTFVNSLTKQFQLFYSRHFLGVKINQQMSNEFSTIH
jgi:hypothetical protein